MIDPIPKPPIVGLMEQKGNSQCIQFPHSPLTIWKFDLEGCMLTLKTSCCPMQKNNSQRTMWKLHQGHVGIPISMIPTMMTWYQYLHFQSDSPHSTNVLTFHMRSTLAPCLDDHDVVALLNKAESQKVFLTPKQSRVSPVQPDDVRRCLAYLPIDVIKRLLTNTTQLGHME